MEQQKINLRLLILKAGDQEVMVCKTHGFGQSQYGHEDHSLSHLAMLEELPLLEIP